MSVLIFSGSNNRAVIAFCRCLEQRKVPFGIIANGKEDPIFSTKYIENVYETRIFNELVIEKVIGYAQNLKIRFNSSSVFILPSTEYLNRFLLIHNELLSKNSINTGLCSPDVYKIISDKISFGNLCNKHGIKIPKSYKNPPRNYPFVAKPKYYNNSKGEILLKPTIIYSKDDLYFYKNNKIDNDYYFQEYINGRSYYLLFYIPSVGLPSVYSQENFLQQGNGGSIILSQSSDYHFGNETAKYLKLFEEVGFKGLVMVEIRSGKDEYMIEANPRIWGPSQLINDSNMDLFDKMLYDNKLINTISSLSYKLGVYYFWSAGIDQSNRLHKEIMYHNFTAEDFIKNYGTIVSSDIYLKKDTLKLYLDRK